jgi:hypothetical protein
MSEPVKVRRRPGFESLANLVGEMLQQASRGEKEQAELLLPMTIGVGILALVEVLELKAEADIPKFYRA